MPGVRHKIFWFHAFMMEAAACLCFLGCASEEHRISLKSFLADTQAAQSRPSLMDSDPKQVGLVREHLEGQLSPYRPGPGDLLGITLVTTDLTVQAPSIQARVQDNGEIKLPIVGMVKAADRSFEEIEADIRKAYTTGIYRDATITVSVVEPLMTEVLVRGAVTQPGVVSLPRNRRNMLSAIVRAGGVSEMASGLVTLHRIVSNEDSRTFNLYDIEDLRTALTLDPLENGDVITVKAAVPNTIFVGGLVNNPHPQIYPMGTEATVLQAIAGANGLRTDVTPREGTLIRRMPNGKEVQIKLDLDRISRGLDANVTLAPGDILWVPETAETKIQDWINRNIFFRAGISATAGANYTGTGVEYLNNNAREVHKRNGSFGNLQDRFDPLGFLQAMPMPQTVQPQ